MNTIFRPPPQPLPDTPFYTPLGNECTLFESAWLRQLPLLLKGPTGCGKTRFVSHMAAKLGLPLLVMAGQETVPAPDELDALADLGFEGFNVYFDHLQPHLLASRLRPMPALGEKSTDADLEAIKSIPGAMLEASIMPFSGYGQPLNDADLARYADISARAGLPVIAPSQKKFTAADMPRLKTAGIAAPLLGVVVTGDTPASLTAAVEPIVRAAA